MKKRPPARATYKPPRIRKVRLWADELAVTGCKSVMVGVNVCRRGTVLVNRTQGS